MSTEQLKQAIAPAAQPAKAQHPAAAAIMAALPSIKAVLPAHLTPDRMAKLSLGVLRTNAKLARAARQNPASFVNAIMDASRLGLEPGFDAHLVPYENRKTRVSEIQLIPDWRGLLALARRSGEITSVMVQVVYANDIFDLELGLEEKLIHKPCLTCGRGEPVLVYGVAKFRDGSHHVEWMSREEVDAIRDRSQGYRTAVMYDKDDAPWIRDYTEMMRKTLVRRMCKYLPRSIEMANAERIVEASDSGATAHMEGEFVVVENEPETESPPPQEPPRRGTGRPRGSAKAQQDPAPATEQSSQPAATAVDTETGEIAQAADSHTYTFAKVAAKIQSAVSRFDLEDAEEMLPLVINDAHRGELAQMIEERKAGM